MGLNGTGPFSARDKETANYFGSYGISQLRNAQTRQFKICWHSADLPHAGLEPKWRTQANVEPKRARIPLHPPSLPTMGHEVQAYTRSPLSAHLLIGEEASSSLPPADVSCGTTSSPPTGMLWHSASSQLTCSCWQ